MFHSALILKINKNSLTSLQFYLKAELSKLLNWFPCSLMSYVNSNVIKSDMRQAGGELSSVASLLGRSSLWAPPLSQLLVATSPRSPLAFLTFTSAANTPIGVCLRAWGQGGVLISQLPPYHPRQGGKKKGNLKNVIRGITAGSINQKHGEAYNKLWSSVLSLLNLKSRLPRINHVEVSVLK